MDGVGVEDGSDGASYRIGFRRRSLDVGRWINIATSSCSLFYTRDMASPFKGGEDGGQFGWTHTFNTQTHTDNQRDRETDRTQTYRQAHKSTSKPTKTQASIQSTATHTHTHRERERGLQDTTTP